ncbi:DUF2489 domain-containing protein [Halomonas sediminis]
MNTTVMLILLGLGLVIVIGLAAYAFTLRREVMRRDRYRQEEERRAQENSLENLDWVISALLQEQVEITEGAWRCKVLLEIIDPNLAEQERFRAFAEMYNRTHHLKTHSARKQLTPRERMQEDKQRLEIENEMRPRVLAAAAAVKKWRQEGPNALH